MISFAGLLLSLWVSAESLRSADQSAMPLSDNLVIHLSDDKVREIILLNGFNMTSDANQTIEVSISLAEDAASRKASWKQIAAEASSFSDSNYVADQSVVSASSESEENKTSGKMAKLGIQEAGSVVMSATEYEALRDKLLITHEKARKEIANLQSLLPASNP
ncbi:MAG: hypothetical protein KDI36_07590 [Pseudomonadales bacterium]|nr:hypothetical protein [Pseudomonadales bacterium]